MSVSLRRLYQVSETIDLVEGFGREPTLSELYMLNEDSRKNIEKFLKLAPEVANKFHDIDSKHSFPLAKGYVIWLSAQHVTDYGAPDRPVQMGGRKEDEAEKGKRSLDLKLINDYMNEMGLKLKEIFVKKPQWISMMNKANSMKDVSTLIASFNKNVGLATDKVVMKFPNGWIWYGPLTREECRGSDEEGMSSKALPGSEADSMGHCATDHRGGLYSLRDTQNFPHITLTWNPERNRVYQIKGHKDRVPVGEEKKYYPYITDLFKETGASMGDDEIRGMVKSGRVWGQKYKEGDIKDVQELAARIDAAAGEYAPFKKMVEKNAAQVEKVFSDPVVRGWVWDLGLISKTQNFYAEDYSTMVSDFEKLMTQKGFVRGNVQMFQFGQREVFYDPQRWTENGAKAGFPPYDQTQTWTGLVVMSMEFGLGLGNPEIVKDPVSWVSQNTANLQSFYDLFNELMLVDKQHRKIRAGAMNRASFTKSPISEEDYERLTKTPAHGDEGGTEWKQTWATPDEFFAEHPELMSSIEAGLDKFANRPQIKQRVLDTLRQSKGFKLSKKGGIFFTTEDGREYKIVTTKGSNLAAGSSFITPA